MDIYKHTAASLTLSSILLLIFKEFQLSISCFLIGVFMDIDHLADYTINHDLREKISYLAHPRKLAEFLANGYKENKPSYKLCKPLHSLELLGFLPLLYILGIWNSIATGIAIGFSAHLIMDLIPAGHISSISFIYKIVNGFPKGSDILKQRLTKNGIDICKCQICGAEGETIVHRDQHYWCIGFTDRSLDRLKILCEKCHDEAHNRAVKHA